MGMNEREELRTVMSYLARQTVVSLTENRGGASLGEKFRFAHVRRHSYLRNISNVDLKLQTDRSGRKVLNRLSTS